MTSACATLPSHPHPEAHLLSDLFAVTLEHRDDRAHLRRLCEKSSVFCLERCELRRLLAEHVPVLRHAALLHRDGLVRGRLLAVEPLRDALSTARTQDLRVEVLLKARELRLELGGLEALLLGGLESLLLVGAVDVEPHLEALRVEALAREVVGRGLELTLQARHRVLERLGLRKALPELLEELGVLRVLLVQVRDAVRRRSALLHELLLDLERLLGCFLLRLLRRVDGGDAQRELLAELDHVRLEADALLLLARLVRGLGRKLPLELLDLALLFDVLLLAHGHLCNELLVAGALVREGRLGGSEGLLQAVALRDDLLNRRVTAHEVRVVLELLQRMLEVRLDVVEGCASLVVPRIRRLNHRPRLVDLPLQLLDCGAVLF